MSNSVSNSNISSVYEQKIDKLGSILEGTDIENFMITAEGERTTENITFSTGMGSVIDDELGIPIPLSNIKIKKIVIYSNEELNDVFFIGQKTTTPTFPISYDVNSLDFYSSESNGLVVSINGLNSTIGDVKFKNGIYIFTLNIQSEKYINLPDDEVFITSVRHIGDYNPKVKLRISLLMVNTAGLIKLTDSNIYSSIRTIRPLYNQKRKCY
jgi:hypothetical protein